MKKYFPYIIFSALIIFLSLVDYYSPKPLDWTPSFNDNDKRPYGKYLMAELAERMFKNGVIPTDSSEYQTLSDSEKTYTFSNQCNYIIITNDWSPDNTSLNTLLNWVTKGNNAFISSPYFPKSFRDSLKFDYNIQFNNNIKQEYDTLKPIIRLRLVNPLLDNKKLFNYYKSFEYCCITKFDTAVTTILGTYEDGDPDFIKIRWGEGFFYLNTSNYIFTNYNIIKGNLDYVSKILSYLPRNSITIWDKKYSPDDPFGFAKPTTPLRYILSNPPLKWAYYILIATLLLYILIKSKRLQRMLPVIKPLRNSSVEFTKTIANLYIQSHDNNVIAEKKFRHFLEVVRNKYNLKNHNIDETLIKAIHLKSGFDLAQIRFIFAMIDKFRMQTNAGDEQLIQFNGLIDNFYKKVNHGKYD